ncbi:hypothetical protein O6H91_08G062700 [Diphasiastrum complanatum]|nr:hypothetical protein O6H91_08G062700 [Diphasiastrum complanatum]
MSTRDLNTDTANSEALEVFSEAVALLLMLPLDEKTRKLLAGSRHISSLSWLLSKGKIEAKITAATLLENLAADTDVKILASDTKRILEGLMELLSGHSWPSAVKISLKCLLGITRCRRTRIKIIEAGFIEVIVELLPGADRVATEQILAILETLSTCAEGREIITQHALAIPMIVKNLLLLSDIATERAVGVLSTVCLHSPDEAVFHEALNAGAFKKLLLLVQLDCGPRIKNMARELLKLFQRIADDCEASTPSYQIQSL